jgi:hypothetical protein
MNATRLTIWVVSAVAAVGVTTAAVTVANATTGRDDVLSQDDVSRELAADTGAPSPPGTTEPSVPPTASTGEARSLSSRPGQVVARCDGSTVSLEAWSPNPGYRVDEVVRGPATEASVWFESDSFEDVGVLVWCEEGEPHQAELIEAVVVAVPVDDGRDDGRSGSDDGGDGDSDD